MNPPRTNGDADLKQRIEDLQQQVAELERSSREAEGARRKIDEKARAILRAIPDLMFRLSEDGEHLDFYAASTDQLFVDPGEFLGKRVDEVLPREAAELYLHNIRQTLNTHQMQVFEYQLNFADAPRHYESRMVVSGEREVLTIVRDISKRKLAERERENLQS